MNLSCRMLVALGIFAWFLGIPSANAQISIINHLDDSTVRYPCILLRGLSGSVDRSAGDVQQKKVSQVSMKVEFIPSPDEDEASSRVSPHSPVVVQKGASFKSLVTLRPGKNRLTVSNANGDESLLTITYKPQTNPHYVRLIWLTANDGDLRYASPAGPSSDEYENRLRTAGILMQTATAEKMHDLGRERKTFRLERDSGGQVVVHTLKAPKSAEYYYGIPDREWWSETWRWLNDSYPDPYAKNVVLASFTRKDPKTGQLKAHTALGGGNLGLFGSASFFSWPVSVDEATSVFQNDSKFDSTQVHNDSAGRNRIWGLASTTMGATLHETGHTFGLPHCTDRFGIMTRGFDHFNRVFTFEDPVSDVNRTPRAFEIDQEARFAQVSASYLQLSPWFQPDGFDSVSAAPLLQFDATAGKLTVSATGGIAWLGVHVESDIHGFVEYPVGERDEKREYSMEDLARIAKGGTVSRVEAMSSSGKSRRLQIR